MALQSGEGGDAIEGAFELADVVLDAVGDEEQDLFGGVEAIAIGFGAEDGEARFDIGGGDVGDQAPFKARAQALF